MTEPYIAGAFMSGTGGRITAASPSRPSGVCRKDAARSHSKDLPLGNAFAGAFSDLLRRSPCQPHRGKPLKSSSAPAGLAVLAWDNLEDIIEKGSLPGSPAISRRKLRTLLDHDRTASLTGEQDSPLTLMDKDAAALVGGLAEFISGGASNPASGATSGTEKDLSPPGERSYRSLRQSAAAARRMGSSLKDRPRDQVLKNEESDDDELSDYRCSPHRGLLNLKV